MHHEEKEIDTDSVKYRWQHWIIKAQIKFQRTSNSHRLIIKVDKAKYFECKYFVWKEERGISRTSGRENSIATTLLREETISAPPSTLRAILDGDPISATILSLSRERLGAPLLYIGYGARRAGESNFR